MTTATTGQKKTTTGKKAETKSGTGSSSNNYTDPALREKLKKQVTAGTKGGRAGQWSARKAQLLTHQYKAQGGGFKNPPNSAQQSLKQWGDEKWQTADGSPATKGGETHRYLPEAAWKELSPGEKKATDRKKVAGSRKGKQFVANTATAKRARKKGETG